MARVSLRPWVTAETDQLVQLIAATVEGATSADIADRVAELVTTNRRIHERNCFNLNPATNVMNPAAEAMLAAGLGTRPSLGHPGAKYETGLEAIEEIEVIAAQLAAETFDAAYAEIRVPSGAIANLYAFMALTSPGDRIIVPPEEVGGHVTHHAAGCAGLYGLESHPAPVEPSRYTIDVERLRALAREVRPRLITLGGSLNLFEHPVAEVRVIADEVGAKLMFDAAHQCGLIAGGTWSNPLAAGADVMTMSTYKSLGGPPSGLILTNDAAIAERLDAIAYPGMTANFDVAKSAALAITLLDWRDFGAAYADQMVSTARALAAALAEEELPVFAADAGFTHSHQFAVEAMPFGGGQAASRTLRRAGFLASGIGLPLAAVAGDSNGLRLGTPEIVRWGVVETDTPRMARLIAEALRSVDAETLAPEVAEWRSTFDRLHYIRWAGNAGVQSPGG